MRVKVFAKTRDGASAEGVYTGEKLIVMPGGRVRNKVAKSVKGGTFVRKYLDNKDYVSPEGVILKECEFNSPSIAAMFLTGNASNGYRVWKTESGSTLGDYLKEKGLR